MKPANCFKSFCFPLLVIMMSCSGVSKEKLALAEVSESLNDSRKTLDYFTAAELMKLEDKLTDHMMVEQTNKWYPKADTFNKLSKKAIWLIDSLQQLLSEENFYDQLAYASGVYQSYSARIIQADPELNYIFKQEADAGNNFNNYNTYTLANLFLTKLKNDIARLANKTISFCNSRCAWTCGLGYEKFAAIVAQSSNHLAPGEELVITAGVGVFSIASKPKIRINNVNISPDESNVAISKIKVQRTPGKYSIPVEMNYIAEDGEIKKHTYNIIYTVGKLQ